MFLAVTLIIVGVAFLAHTAPFPFLLEAFRPKRSVWHISPPPGVKPIYLTFDDGPNEKWTASVLDALRDEGARATFFLIDEHITAETEWLVKRIAADGHAIGLHSGSRKPVVVSPEALAAQLAKTADRITAIAQREPCRFFRPHAGWRSATMYDALSQIDYQLAGWSWGMWDWHWWKKSDPRAVAERLERKASPGDIIVIHDGHHKDPRKDRSHAGGAVRLLVPALRARGYTFVPLCSNGNGNVAQQ
jgi:peptidoglycan/xylan/chitin deacetylase (PgdA/CDA1 family)